MPILAPTKLTPQISTTMAARTTSRRGTYVSFAKMSSRTFAASA